MNRVSYPFVALLASLTLADDGLPVQAQTSRPYDSIVIWTATGRCYSQYGIGTKEKSTQVMLDLARKQFGMEPYQVLNLMKGDSFQKDVSAFIAKSGGCRAMADAFKRRQK